MATPEQRLITEAAFNRSARDSGERNVTTLVTGAASGSLYLSRTGPWVTLDLEGLVPAAAGSWTIITLPRGFRAERSNLEHISTGSETRSLNLYVDGRVIIWGVSTSDSFRDSIRFRTKDTWPATYPGTGD